MNHLTIIAVDLVTDSVSHLQMDPDEPFHELLEARPKLVLFIPTEGLDGPHTHLRYFFKRGRVRHRLCHLTDVPAKVRAAFLLAN